MAPIDGTHSPALERYRLARAEREELACERDLGKWIAVDDVHTGMSILAGGRPVRNTARARAPTIAATAMIRIRLKIFRACLRAMPVTPGRLGRIDLPKRGLEGGKL